MRFKMSKRAQDFFSDIISSKSKFSYQFDVYYCCALIGMAAVQRDDETSDLSDLIDGYPQTYINYKDYIAGLLVATEAKRIGIDIKSNQLEQIMLKYLSNDNTMLSEEGIKALNAYSLKGYYLIHEYPLVEKPTSREEFLEAFNLAIRQWEIKH